VRQGASNVVFVEGSQSTYLMRDLYANATSQVANAAAATFVNQTVGDYFRTTNLNDPTKVIKAIAELNGTLVFLNPSYWGSNRDSDKVTVIHEILHNITGHTDDDFARMLNGDLSSMLRRSCL